MLWNVYFLLFGYNQRQQPCLITTPIRVNNHPHQFDILKCRRLTAPQDIAIINDLITTLIEPDALMRNSEEGVGLHNFTYIYMDDVHRHPHPNNHQCQQRVIVRRDALLPPSFRFTSHETHFLPLLDIVSMAQSTPEYPLSLDALRSICGAINVSSTENAGMAALTQFRNIALKEPLSAHLNDIINMPPCPIADEHWAAYKRVDKPRWAYLERFYAQLETHFPSAQSPENIVAQCQFMTDVFTLYGKNTPESSVGYGYICPQRAAHFNQALAQASENHHTPTLEFISA